MHDRSDLDGRLTNSVYDPVILEQEFSQDVHLVLRDHTPRLREIAHLFSMGEELLDK